MAMLLARGGDVVKLNVGGVLYATSRTTLTKYNQSMLSSMFTNRMPSTQDDQGNYFIDRNGKLFEHVLQFLRTGRLELPCDFKEVEALCLEADFYQIQPLIVALQKHKAGMGRFSDTSSQYVMICWLLGHDLSSTSVCHYQIYCKCDNEAFKRRDYTFGKKLTLQSFHNYLEKQDEWKLVKSETMTESNAAAFFLSMGFEESPFRKELTYTNVKIEVWKKARLF